MEILFKVIIALLILILIIIIMSLVEYIRKGNENKQLRRLEIIILIITAIIFLVQSTILKTQTDISATQTQILEKTSIPNRPEIDLNIRSETVPIFSASNIVNDKDVNNLTGLIFELHAINLGKMDSGPVQVWLRNSWTRSTPFYFGNISSGEEVYKNIRFSSKDCFGRYDPENCNITDVPLREQTLEFQIFCSKCKPQYSYYNITVCIWQDYEKDCGKFT